MKSNTKLNIIILITLGIFFTLSSTVNNSLNFHAENGDAINLDDEILKISKISDKIHIINNSGWVDFRNDGNCTGSGTYSDPYIIEDLVIDGGGSGRCIWVENSDVYFKIENCTVYNPRYNYPGILLSNVNNSQLVANNCSSIHCGISLGGSNNNTISGNFVNNCTGGISLRLSNNNTISGNFANYCETGIYLADSNNNHISGNFANYCENGIYLYIDNNYNHISGNYVSNNTDLGMFLVGGNYNTITGNTANYNGYGMYLKGDNYDNISGNIASYNRWNGIALRESNNNIISGNTVNYNENGIRLHFNSNFNIVSGNTLRGNKVCINETQCEGNVFKNNDCGGKDEIIPGYNLFFLLVILSAVAIILIKKLKKS